MRHHLHIAQRLEGCWTAPKALALGQPTDTLGISQAVIDDSHGTAAKLMAAARSDVPTVDVVKSFDPAQLVAQLDMQGGHLAGSAGVVQLKVTNSSGKVLTTKDAAYAIAGGTLYLKNPEGLRNWLASHAPALISQGANGIRIAANLPLIQDPGSSGVRLRAIVKYDNHAILSTTGRFWAPLRIASGPGCLTNSIVPCGATRPR